MKIKYFIKIISYTIAILSVIPVVPHINFIYAFIFFSSILISFKVEFEKRLFLNILSLLSILITLKNVSMNNLVIPALESVIILLSVKSLEKKKFRDYMQIYALSIFCLSGFSLLSINMIFLLYLAIELLLLSTASVFLTFFDKNEEIFLDSKEMLKIAYKSSFIFFLSIPLTVLIFFILPRIEYPFFDFLNNGTTAVTGFTDKITLGDINEIQQDNSVIFRVKMPEIDNRELYWRGAVLNEFNGKTWEKSRDIQETEPPEIISNKKPIKQIIYLEPYYGKYLFTLDKPLKIKLKHIKKDNTLTYACNENILKRFKYFVYSTPNGYIFQQRINTKNYLQVPNNISKKLFSLAENFISDNPFKTLENITSYFKQAGFKYSLTNLTISEHPVENFLFKNKKGNCEYFASAFAILLRLANIPSRIVVGYRGGEYSKLGGYYIVSQKNAHAWTEAYIEQKWLRIDPSNFSANVPVSLKKKSIPEKLNIRMILDLINYYYIVFLIDYDFNTQLNILKSVYEIKKINLFSKDFLKKAAIFTILLICLIIIVIYLSKYFKTKNDSYILKKFLKTLEKAGYKRKKGDTLGDIVNKVKEKDMKKYSEKFVSFFENIYYKDKTFSKKDINYLNVIIKKIKLLGKKRDDAL